MLHVLLRFCIGISLDYSISLTKSGSRARSLGKTTSLTSGTTSPNAFITSFKAPSNTSLSHSSSPPPLSCTAYQHLPTPSTMTPAHLSILGAPSLTTTTNASAAHFATSPLFSSNSSPPIDMEPRR